MKMRPAIARALIGAVAAVTTATPALAQSVTDVVVMRRQVGAPATFTPTWGAWSTCSNSKRTRTMASCTMTRQGSSPVAVSNSSCGATTATETCVSGTTCGTLAFHYYANKGGGGDGISPGTAADLATAQSVCAAKASSTGVKGVCMWDSSNRNMYWFANFSDLAYGATYAYATVCQ